MAGMLICESPDVTLHIELSDELLAVRCASSARFPEAELQLGPMRYAIPTDFSILSNGTYRHHVVRLPGAIQVIPFHAFLSFLLRPPCIGAEIYQTGVARLWLGPAYPFAVF